MSASFLQVTVFASTGDDSLFDNTIKKGFYCIGLEDFHTPAWNIMTTMILILLIAVGGHFLLSSQHHHETTLAWKSCMARRS